MDITRDKAERLVDACNGLGLRARLHWDRSPWCCQVALTTATDDFDENTPSIFFMLEEAEPYYIRGHGANKNAVIGWRWGGQLQVDRTIPEQDELYDINFQILERTWLGDNQHSVAQKIVMLVSMLDVSALPISD